MYFYHVLVRALRFKQLVVFVYVRPPSPLIRAKTRRQESAYTRLSRTGTIRGGGGFWCPEEDGMVNSAPYANRFFPREGSRVFNKCVSIPCEEEEGG